MKKLLYLTISFLISLLFLNTSFWNWCTVNLDEFNWDVKIWEQIDNCMDWSHQISWKDVDLKTWFATQIKSWVNNISLFLWIFAVWTIVFWALNMTLSAWEEEKIKKSKDIIKWWIIWFIWLISITAIITLIIKIMYSI